MVDKMKVTVYAVGQGMCSVVEGLDNEGKLEFLALMDCGSENTNGSSVIKEMVLDDIRTKMKKRATDGQEFGTYRLDLLVVSHGDGDHYNWLEELFSGMSYLSGREIEWDENRWRRELHESGQYNMLYYNLLVTDSHNQSGDLLGTGYDLCLWKQMSNQGPFFSGEGWQSMFNKEYIKTELYGIDRYMGLWGVISRKRIDNIHDLTITKTYFIHKTSKEAYATFLIPCEIFPVNRMMDISLSYVFESRLLEYSVRMGDSKFSEVIMIRESFGDTFREVCMFLQETVIERNKTLYPTFQGAVEKAMKIIGEAIEIQLKALPFNFDTEMNDISNYITQQNQGSDQCVIKKFLMGGEYDYIAGRYINGQVADDRSARPVPMSIFNSVNALVEKKLWMVHNSMGEIDFPGHGMGLKTACYDQRFLESLKSSNAANASSLVSSITNIQGGAALFPGDATHETMKWLTENQTFNGSSPEVMLAPHHGAIRTAAPYADDVYDDSIIENFLSVVNPQRIVISAAMNSQFGHPQATSAYIYRDYFITRLRYCKPHYFLYNLNDLGRQNEKKNEFFEFRMGKTKYPIYSSVTADMHSEEETFVPIYYSICIWDDNGFEQQIAFDQDDPLLDMYCEVVQDFDRNWEPEPETYKNKDIGEDKTIIMFQPAFVQER